MIMELDSIVDFMKKEALSHEIDDVSAIGTSELEEMVRFSNNSVTVVKSLVNISLAIYLGYDKRRVIGILSNPSESAIRKFIESLIKNCRSSPQTDEYVSLPRGPFTYSSNPECDKSIVGEPERLVEYARLAIDSSMASGASRTSGSVTSHVQEMILSTSSGAQARETGTSILLNVRAFADDDASGHGLSCGSTVKMIDAEEAGRRAGDYAKRARGPKECKEGKYDILFIPTVAADLFQYVGAAASAFSVDTGTSFLANMVGENTAIDDISVSDIGVPSGGISGRGFDDEGYPTGKTPIIADGLLQGYLHNSTTAKKFNSETTGNAGIIDPHPWNLEIDPGSYQLEEMIEDIDEGILVTNNWYTRFQNLRAGAYSTIPRDATFMIENGAIGNPIQGIRISDTLPRQLKNIGAISKHREWIKWWEVDTPTFSPAIVVNDVSVTRAIS